MSQAGSANPYAAGAKVYNGGSSAATQGAVDPTGYIDRSLRRQSGYTPGVAAGALNTLRSASPSLQGQGQPTSPSSVGAQPAPITPPTPAPTQSSTTGTISWKMPVDYDLQMQGIQANSDYNDLLTQITAIKNNAAQNETIGLRDAAINETKQGRRDTNVAAYRGMARSSGYVNQVDETQQFFNNLRTDVESKFMAALNGADAQALAGKSRVDSTMESIYSEAARRLADKIANDPNAGALDPITGLPATPGTTKPTGGQGGGTAPTPPPKVPTNTPTKPPAAKPKKRGYTNAELAAAKKRGYTLEELKNAKIRKAKTQPSGSIGG